MVTKQEFNESQIVRKNKVCTGAVIFDWTPPALKKSIKNRLKNDMFNSVWK